MNKFKLFSIVFGLAFVLVATVARADVKEIKLLKEAYPDVKAKCTYCHTDEKPKKEDGQHELNAYGKKALETKERTADTYKALGNPESAK